MHNNTELLYNFISLGYYVLICFDDGDKIIGGQFDNSLLNSVQFDRTLYKDTVNTALHLKPTKGIFTAYYLS